MDKEKLVIKGGINLNGEVIVSGAKNSALIIMASTILTEDEVYLDNMPNLSDIENTSKLLKALGAETTKISNNFWKVNAKSINTIEAPYEIVSKMRASFLILGPLLARFGEAKVPLPGGCAIGSRPVDIHLKGLKALGAEVKIEHGFAIVKAQRLKGNKIYFDFPSVGATENVMMAATLAEGKTIIENVAREPEIVDLANFLISMGAKITGAGSPTITIEGVEKLHGCTYSIMPDRIEAGTFMLAAAATRGDVTVVNARAEHLQSLISKMLESRVNVEILSPNEIRVNTPTNLIKGVDVKTLTYPGFFTDLQSPMIAFLCTAKGTSIVHETVFENRFMYIDELNRMGANIKTESNFAIIKGVPGLSGAPVKASDLRAASALAIASFVADGTSEITKLHHLDRGYENFEAKFRALGANIERVSIRKPISNQ